ncbi:myotubularin-related protein DDB_G0290005-like isoform X1 [Homarus americanus]|nr:myotubularin-related protein DDB_G0290005-like isoform X1 [Homarus americanus]
MDKFMKSQQQLVKSSFSSLPPEKYRQQTVGEVLKRQQQVQEQLQQARSSYFSLMLKKQRQEEELQTRQEVAEDQVSTSEMLRLVVETEAYTEEAAIQENNILTYKSSLTNMTATINKRTQRKKELSAQVDEAQARVNKLKIQLKQEKERLNELAKKQSSSRRKSSQLEPSSRLLLDPLLARDLKDKLVLRTTLEDELHRLKQVCCRGTASHSPPR